MCITKRTQRRARRADAIACATTFVGLIVLMPAANFSAQSQSPVTVAAAFKDPSQEWKDYPGLWQICLHPFAKKRTRTSAPTAVLRLDLAPRVFFTRLKATVVGGSWIQKAPYAFTKASHRSLRCLFNRSLAAKQIGQRRQPASCTRTVLSALAPGPTLRCFVRFRVHWHIRASSIS